MAIGGTGSPAGFGLPLKPGTPETDFEFVYELPAPTTFDRFVVPNVLETPSPNETFVRSVEVHGSTAGAGGSFGFAQVNKVPSAFVLGIADGSLRGVRSTNGGPFSVITAESAAGVAPTCPQPPPPIGCGAIIHGFALDGVGVGEARPMLSNVDESGRALNRRVEVHCK